MGTMQQRLAILKALIYVASVLSIFLLFAVIGSVAIVLRWLPDDPSAALIALLQTAFTGLVGALTGMVGALGTSIGAYFAFRSAKETSGEDTPSAL